LTLYSTKAGFGLGALNEAEDDDIDIYDTTTHANRTYMPYDAIRDADDGSGVNRSKLIRKVARFFFLSQNHHGLIIGRLLQQRNGGSPMEWSYSQASFSLQTLYRRNNGDCFSITRGYSSHRAW
jgi:hypothetical protein